LIGDAPVSLARNSAAKTPSPNPARIPPQTSPPRGQNAKSNQLRQSEKSFPPEKQIFVLPTKSLLHFVLEIGASLVQ